MTFKKVKTRFFLAQLNCLDLLNAIYKSKHSLAAKLQYYLNATEPEMN